MTERRSNITPLFLALIPLFLVLNGMNQFHSLVSWRAAIGLSFLITLIIFAVYFLISSISGSRPKAALATAWIAILYLFFGTLHDELKSALPSFITSYKYFLPLWLVILVIGVLLIRRARNRIIRFGMYLNILFILLCLYEGGRLLLRREQKADFFLPVAGQDSFITGRKVSKPDIYLLVFDSYLEPGAFQKKYGPTKENIDSFLREKGFFVCNNSRSDYNNTTASISSMLNMSRLNTDGYFSRISPDQSYPTQLRLIASSRSCNILSQLGYQLKNGSLFKLNGSTPPFKQPYLPSDKTLLLEKTLPNKLVQDVFPLEWIVKYKLKFLYDKYVYSVRAYNEATSNFLQHQLSSHENVPVFVYSHFLFPHAPYYFDAVGSPINPEQLMNDEKFPGYYAYAGNEIRKYVNMILQRDSLNSVIVVMSDHGIHDPENSDKDLQYRNLFSIYYPDRNYASLDDSIALPNCFRLIFNKYFGQHYSLIR